VVLLFCDDFVGLPHWQTIAQTIRRRREEGFRLVVVCPASRGISEALEVLVHHAAAGSGAQELANLEKRHLDLAEALGVEGTTLLAPHFETMRKLVAGIGLLGEVPPRSHARILALGERMTTQLGAAFLSRNGLDVQWHDARELLTAMPVPASTSPECRYLEATCDFAPDSALDTALTHPIILTQSSIARDPEGETVLLGRGGADTSAACLAARLQACRLELWTDVPGLFTANPHAIPTARLITQADYAEAQELATTGATVLHPACLAPVRRHHIPLYIRSARAPDLPGTVISHEATDKGPRVKAISVKKGVVLISMETLGMWRQVGFLADIFAVVKRHGVSVDLMATSEANVTVSLDPTANALTPEGLDALVADLAPHCTPRVIAPCAVISLVGRHIRSILPELAQVFEAFDARQLYLISQAASDLNFSFVVDEEQVERTVRRLHARLFDNRVEDTDLGATWNALNGKAAAAVSTDMPWWVTRREDLLALGTQTTPRYVYDEATLDARIDHLRSSLPLDRIFYALKANPHPALLQRCFDAGLGFECVSPGELDLVCSRFPGIEPQRLLFTPNFAPRHEYAKAFDAGAFVTIDNLYLLEHRPEVFEGREVVVRVDSGYGAGHHPYVRTAGSQSKFGILPDDLPRLRERAEALGTRIIGLHAHVGSGILDADNWTEVAAVLARLSNTFPDARILNIGGGLGVPPRRGAPGLDLYAVGAHLRAFKAAVPGMELWMEPGRFIVAEAGILLARVTQVKGKGGRHFVGLDAGFHTLLRPALYGAYHEIVNLTRLDAPPAMEADVVGPICETGDVLGHHRLLPATEEGDLFLIATAGAYGHSMSSAYNLRGFPSETVLPAVTVKV